MIFSLEFEKEAHICEGRLKMFSNMQRLKKFTSLQLCLEAKGGDALPRQRNQDRRQGVQEIDTQWKLSRREAEETPEGIK